MLLGNTAHVGRRVFPPLLGEQESLVDDVEWPAVPIFANEARIVGRRLDARWPAFRSRHAQGRVAGEPDHLSYGPLGQLQSLSRGPGKMDEPVEISFRQRRRR